MNDETISRLEEEDLFCSLYMCTVLSRRRVARRRIEENVQQTDDMGAMGKT